MAEERRTPPPLATEPPVRLPVSTPPTRAQTTAQTTPPAAAPPVTTSPATAAGFAAVRADSAAARAERRIIALGDRILVERLHRALDEGGVAGHLAFCTTMLPYLQGLVTLLPRLVPSDGQAAAVETLHALITRLQEQGGTPQDAVLEATNFYECLHQEIASGLSDDMRPLVDALIRLNQTLTQAWRELAPAPDPDAVQQIVHLDYIDGVTGLPARHYFEERLGEEILRAQRLRKGLTIVLIDVVAGATADAGANEHAVRGMATALLSSIRGFDVAAHFGEGRFGLLLPETTRTGAAAILSRLARGAEQALQFRVGIGCYPKDGETVHALMQKVEGVLRVTAPRTE